MNQWLIRCGSGFDALHRNHLVLSLLSSDRHWRTPASALCGDRTDVKRERRRRFPVIAIMVATLLLSLNGCGPSYRWVPPVGHPDADTSWDIAYCQERERGPFDHTTPEECFAGRGWTLEAVR